MKKIFFLGLFCLFILSCKNESTKEHKTIHDIDKVNDEQFKVVIEGIFTKNDAFKVYYALDTNKKFPFSEKLSQRKFIFGNNKMQKIVFNLPYNIQPKTIMIGFGKNKNQKDIIIKNISFIYKGNSIDGDYGDFQYFFNSNSSVYFDEENFIYHLKEINNNYSPYLTGNDSLKKRLIKLYIPEVKK